MLLRVGDLNGKLNNCSPGCAGKRHRLLPLTAVDAGQLAIIGQDDRVIRK